MQRVVRFGISIEPELLEKFDRLIKNKNYANRSEAIRDLIRKSLIEKSVENIEENAIGTLTIVYNHRMGGIMHELIHLQNSRSSLVRSTMHIHLDEKNCLEVLAIEGKVKNIKKVAEQLKAMKGVKFGELVILSPSSL